MTTERVAALIPSYDVEATIADVVRGARAHVGPVLVVDDGSHDDTATAAEGAGAEVLRAGRNRGKGASLRSGMQRLREQGYTHAFSLDGDGQHLPSEMPVLLEECRAAPRAIVVGVRRPGEGQRVAPSRQFGNRFANRWVEIAAGRAFPDTQSGFRVYPLRETLALDARADRFGFESEVLILAARRGVEVRSRPVEVYYPPPEELVSHFDPWADTVRMIGTILPLALGWRR